MNMENSNNKLEPFQKILVRNSVEDKWFPAFFSNNEVIKGKDCFVTTASEVYEYCIPYEGNEELIYTSDEKKED